MDTIETWLLTKKDIDHPANCMRFDEFSLPCPYEDDPHGMVAGDNFSDWRDSPIVVFRNGCVSRYHLDGNIIESELVRDLGKLAQTTLSSLVLRICTNEQVIATAKVLVNRKGRFVRYIENPEDKEKKE